MILNCRRVSLLDAYYTYTIEAPLQTEFFNITLYVCLCICVFLSET